MVNKHLHFALVLDLQLLEVLIRYLYVLMGDQSLFLVFEVVPAEILLFVCSLYFFVYLLVPLLVALIGVEDYKLVCFICLVLDQFVFIHVIQEQEDLDVAEETELHSFLYEAFLAFAKGNLF